MKIAVIGAGIIGLSTTSRLVEAGHEVAVFSRAFSPHTTSDRAAAFWLPYHIRNDRRGIRWCRTSYDYYKALSKDPSTGITMKKLVKMVADDVAEVDRSWKDFMPDNTFHPIEKEKLPPGYIEGDIAVVPLIETQIFLPWLRKKIESFGVAFYKREINSFALPDDYEIIVNCSGLGARALCNDEQLIPYRGQVALLSPAKGLPIFLDNEKPQYIVPREDAIIIGGTYEANVWEETTEPGTIELLLEKAYSIYPELRTHEFLGSWAGLRPYRDDVRMERTGKIIHNYGHGGSGFTLAFGCADEVINLLHHE